MGKRLRRPRSVCCCVSPRCSFLVPHSIFSWYEVDTWTHVAKFLDGKSLLRLSLTCRWFCKLLRDESIWKFACLRDLQVPDPRQVGFKWSQIYASAFNGSHSYMCHQQLKHIDWMRLGSFLFDSNVSFLTESLSASQRVLKEASVERMLQFNGRCVLKDIKPGMWLAGMQLVRCPVCNLNLCDGTMQILDTRHTELFLNKEYREGSWDTELLGTYDIKKRVSAASGAIFDVRHLRDKNTAGLFNVKSWVGKSNDWQPKSFVALHAVAMNTNLQENEGLHIKYHALRAGKGGKIMSFRISQQLLLSLSNSSTLSSSIHRNFRSLP